MMWIGLSVEPDRRAVETAFARHAPGATLFWGELVDNETCDISITVEPNPSEFPFRLNIWLPPAYDAYDMGLKLARELSLAQRCSTICDGTRHGPTRAPFWSIVWVEGQAFLADDCDTVFADYSDDLTGQERSRLGPVKRVRPLQIEPGPDRADDGA